MAYGFGLGMPFAGMRSGRHNPIPDLSPAAYFKFNTGITITGSGVSQWDDQSGNGRHLLQGTDAFRPTNSGGILTFNGTSQFMKCSAFTLNQPNTIYMRVLQISWTANRRFYDGNTNDVATLAQQNAAVTGVSPNIVLYAGAYGPQNLTTATLGAYHSIGCVANGASSVMNVDGTESTGNPSTGNAGGFTLAAKADGSFNGNLSVKEVAIFSSAHDATTRASVIAYLSIL